MERFQSALMCLVLIASAEGYERYQAKVPNGGTVPSPCNKDILWVGLGHTTPSGGGARSKFATDFHDVYGEVWNEALCKADSDGDGKTNGEELGDPDCLWKKGDAAPGNSSMLTHPGICEPTDTKECSERNAGFTLDGCPVYKGEGTGGGDAAHKVPEHNDHNSHDHSSHDHDQDHGGNKAQNKDDKENGAAAMSSVLSLSAVAALLLLL